MKDPTTRFSDRVDDYSNFRPNYPRQVLDYYKHQLGLAPDWKIADIGSGTGIFTQHFIANGNSVFGVEPNAKMREAAENALASDNFISIDGTEIDTGITDCSIDLIVAAQAFHWFDPHLFVSECLRIAKPHACISLLWNERLVEIDSFHRQYEDLIIKHASDYLKIDHRKTGIQKLKKIQPIEDYQYFEVDNKQTLNFAGLKGRLLSSSYVPKGDDAVNMIDDLKTLFEKYHENGILDLKYKTKVYSIAIKDLK
ncbi:MAG: class I SAM-dependent methyltransferase [Bacteroidia bacterium]|nr:class I SAM-dependent methyltransferase [Bacteroidia bacterium]